MSCVANTASTEHTDTNWLYPWLTSMKNQAGEQDNECPNCSLRILLREVGEAGVDFFRKCQLFTPFSPLASKPVEK